MTKTLLALAVLACCAALGACSIACGGGEEYCPDDSSCCATASGGWSCCPFRNAVCCPDHVHCCPGGYPICMSNGGCESMRGEGMPWYVAAFTMPMPKKAAAVPAPERHRDMIIHALTNPSSPRGYQHCQQLTVPGGKASKFWAAEGWRYTTPPFVSGSCPSYFNYVNRIMHNLAGYEGVTWVELGVHTAEQAKAGAVAPKPEAIVPGPIHASCRLTWQFTADCATVSAAIAKAARSMSGLSNCGSSEKCGYSITTVNSTYYEGQHETPKHHYMDRQTMSFSDNADGCFVHAFSTSEVWYAILDDGTNYCDLENLQTASGLSAITTCSDNTCTQYSSANCDKY